MVVFWAGRSFMQIDAFKFVPRQFFVIAFITLAVMARGMALSIGAVAAEVLADYDFAYRIIAALFGQLTSVTTIAVAVAAYQRQKRLNQALAKQTRQLVLLQEATFQKGAQIRAEVNTEVKRKIDPLLATFRESLSHLKIEPNSIARAQRAYQLAIARLDAFVSTLRAPAVIEVPLTNETQAVGRSRVKWQENTRVGMNLHPLVSLVLIVIPALSQAARTMSLAGLVSFAVVCTLTVFLVVFVLRLALRRWWVELWFALLISGFINAVAAWLAIEIALLLLPNAPTGLVLTALVVGFNAGAVGALFMWLVYSEARLEQELREVNQSLRDNARALRQSTWLTRRRLMVILHGQVQGALHAANLRLGFLAEDSDEFERKRILTEIEHDLYVAMDRLEQPSKSEVSFDETLEEIAATWQVTCRFEYRISSEASHCLENDEALAEIVCETVREATHNAVVHGEATSCQVSLGLDVNSAGAAGSRRSIVIEVADDGHGPLPRTAKGFGSLMLDEITDSWSLTRANHGTKFVAHLIVPDLTPTPFANREKLAGVAG